MGEVGKDAASIGWREHTSSFCCCCCKPYMISQFFILSPRGDTIITKDYRGDAVVGIADIFFRRVKFWEQGDAPPVFNIDGTHFIFIKKSGMYLVTTTKFNVSPSMILELLCRLAKVFKDYCGVLTEESIRKNFTLIYELLDEVMDYGFPQGTTTESLKAHVYNEPVVVEAVRQASFKVPQMNQKTTPSSSVHRPIAIGSQRNNRQQKNEIFVDILERLNVLFSANGYILNSSIDGCIQMKSYLSGNPELRLALNEDLVIGKGEGYGSVILDDCNFHECVRLDDFESQRAISFVPPDGEFTVMNYRLTGEFRAPFRVFPAVEQLTPYKLELVLMIRADVPENNYGANVVVTFPVPRTTTAAVPSVGAASAGQTAEYVQNEGQVRWTLKKFVGATEQTLRCRITLSQPITAAQRKELGPVSMSFEIPMYNVSNLAVRHLRISERQKSYNPYRWVRYVTQSSSYVCRM